MNLAALRTTLIDYLERKGAAIPRPPLMNSRLDLTTPDPGYFGPDSASWKIHSSRTATLGGVRAVLMQSLLPEVMDGFVKHSAYRSDPWGRLIRTAEYIGVTTFGTRAEADAAGKQVRRVHERLGLADEAMLIWVHIGFVSSLLDVYERTTRKVDSKLRDQYLREQVIAAGLVGIDPQHVPSTYEQMTAYLAQMAPMLRATKEAKSAFRFLLAPPLRGAFLLTPARAYWGSIVWISFLSLPRDWRVQLAGEFFAGLPRLVDVQTNLRIGLFEKAYGRLPSILQKGPHVRAAEARLGLGGTEFLYLTSNPRVGNLVNKG